MYKFLIPQYQRQPFDSYYFNLALTYYIKKNDFNTVKEIIEKTNWRSEKNLHIVKIIALFDCSLYKRPTYKLFDFLFSQIIYEDPPYTYGYKITAEEIKKFDLHKVIENCLNYEKLPFLNKLLKNYDYLNLIEHTIHFCIKSHKNELCKEFYEANKTTSIREDIIKDSVKYKNIPMLDYISKEYNIFMRYSSSKAKKIFDTTLTEHCYNDKSRYIELMEINHKITDNIIIKHINPEVFSYCLKKLLNKNRNKTASRWIKKLNNKELSFGAKYVDVLRDIKVNLEKLSLKSLIVYFGLVKDNTFNPPDLLSDYRYVTTLNKKILNAISHNKVGYLNCIKNKFKLEKILFNSFLVDSYYTEMSEKSTRLEHELQPIILEKK